jgi:hypothetical protein
METQFYGNSSNRSWSEARLNLDTLGLCSEGWPAPAATVDSSVSSHLYTLKVVTSPFFVSFQN